MSYHNVGTDVFLIPWSEGWVTWCPSVDIFTQGDNPDHAIGMTVDALTMVFIEDLASFRWEGELQHPHSYPERVSKRVTHPLRRGRESHVSTDEHWQAYDDYCNRRGIWLHQTSVAVSELIPEMGPVIVLANVSVMTRGGIVQVVPSVNDYALVPARAFDYRVQQVREYGRVVCVPAALLEPGAPLRGIGMSVEAVALSHINPELGENILQWSVKERA